MRFLADMGVAQRIVGWLRSAGHDAVHLREQGLGALSDRNIVEKAAVEGRIVLTFDLDFGEIIALSGSRSVSAIVFRLRNTRTDHVQARLEVVLRTSGEALAAGAIVSVEESQHRVRKLPVGK